MRELGKVDAALLPFGGTVTMDMEEAVEGAIAIQPKVVIPMHRSKANPQDYVSISRILDSSVLISSRTALSTLILLPFSCLRRRLAPSIVIFSS
jgi:hypothetical protein